MGCFKIVHDVEGVGEVSFKFHQKSKLQGGASVTVSMLCMSQRISETLGGGGQAFCDPLLLSTLFFFVCVRKLSAREGLCSIFCILCSMY